MDLEDLRAVSTTATQPQVLSAYRAGLFPMGIGEGGTGRIGWWAPRRRGVLLPGGLKVSTSLRKSARRFEFSVDRAFDQVIRACADPSRPGRWITADIIRLYTDLHRSGWAHSVEVWSEGRLVGGLYGVAIGSLFAGESMFHAERDASKAALARLVGLLDENPSWTAPASASEPAPTSASEPAPASASEAALTSANVPALTSADAPESSTRWIIDTQWQTPHLATLGVSEISGLEYSARLDSALRGDHCQAILNN